MVTVPDRQIAEVWRPAPSRVRLCFLNSWIRGWGFSFAGCFRCVYVPDLAKQYSALLVRR